MQRQANKTRTKQEERWEVMFIVVCSGFYKSKYLAPPLNPKSEGGFEPLTKSVETVEDLVGIFEDQSNTTHSFSLQSFYLMIRNLKLPL